MATSVGWPPFVAAGSAPFFAREAAVTTGLEVDETGRILRNRIGRLIDASSLPAVATTEGSRSVAATGGAWSRAAAGDAWSIAAAGGVWSLSGGHGPLDACPLAAETTGSDTKSPAVALGLAVDAAASLSGATRMVLDAGRKLPTTMGALPTTIATSMVARMAAADAWPPSVASRPGTSAAAAASGVAEVVSGAIAVTAACKTEFRAWPLSKAMQSGSGSVAAAPGAAHVASPVTAFRAACMATAAA
mmetsp:Transcript_56948/g.158570  ORF Transcript_56948/g.158570 Transcript_56948/m.158570 type:complete len:247 (+) Transcript_56948:107-847(+)